MNSYFLLLRNHNNYALGHGTSEHKTLRRRMQMVVYVCESVRKLKTETVSSPMQYKTGTALYGNLNSEFSGLEFFFLEPSGVLSVL
jgi:hypothetical protein